MVDASKVQIPFSFSATVNLRSTTFSFPVFCSSLELCTYSGIITLIMNRLAITLFLHNDGLCVLVRRSVLDSKVHSKGQHLVKGTGH